MRRWFWSVLIGAAFGGITECARSAEARFLVPVIEGALGAPEVLLTFQLPTGDGEYELLQAASLEGFDAAAEVLVKEPLPVGGLGTYRVPTVAGAAVQFYRLRVRLAAWKPDPERWATVASGQFRLGSPADELGHQSDEAPPTEVVLREPFYLARFEVTQAEYEQLMQVNPSTFQGDPHRPVDSVSWSEAVAYCAALTEQERTQGRLPSGYEYRLPTEAEWEYAARADTTARFSFGDDLDYAELGQYAWFLDNSEETTHAVGQKEPTAGGFYDLYGNVAEWCLDWYGAYPGGRVVDPRGPLTGLDRVIRGGSYVDEGEYCRSAFRLTDWTADRFENVGFRVVLGKLYLEPPPDQMEVVWLAPGQFVMGSPETEQERGEDEGPQMFVTLTQGLYLGRFEVTQAQYAAVMGDNPSRYAGCPNCPVENLTWEQAVEFCTRYTEQERQAGRLPEGHVYRLPTEAEWEYAARAGTRTRFSFGDDPGYAALGDYAWYRVDTPTHGVGAKFPNPWGLYDLYGNVAEWCADWYGDYAGGAVINPTGPEQGLDRVIRGGCFNDEGDFCRSAFRLYDWKAKQFDYVGFRVALAPVQAPPPAPPIELVWVPPGEFLMGSPVTEADREPDEGPQTRVKLTRGFYIGKCEITQAQFAEVMGTNRSQFRGPTRPAQNVSWDDAVEFCALLTERERAAGRLAEGQLYRLPTEAEWEYAARGGTTTRFSYGDDPAYREIYQYGWVISAPPMGAGTRRPNPLGLCDIHGNVSEWCADWHFGYAGGTVIDPTGWHTGTFRVHRGGSFDDAAKYCRSAFRCFDFPEDRYPAVGLRVVLGEPLEAL